MEHSGSRSLCLHVLIRNLQSSRWNWKMKEFVRVKALRSITLENPAQGEFRGEDKGEKRKRKQPGEPPPTSSEGQEAPRQWLWGGR